MINSTYSRSGTTVTVTAPNHNLVAGQFVYCDFTSGGAADGTYAVLTVTDNTTFTLVTNATGTITTGNVTWLKTGRGTLTAATFTRATTTVTVTSANHGLTTGNAIFIVWGASSGQTDNYYGVTVTGTNTFTVTGVNSGTTPGTLSWILTTGTAYDIGATFSQSGTTITISKNAHGYSTNDQLALLFCGSKTPPSRLYTIDSSSTNSFTVTADVVPTATITGGALVAQTQIQGSYVFNSSTSAQLERTETAQRAAFRLTSLATADAQGLNLGQFAAFTLRSKATSDINAVTQAQAALYVLRSTARIAAGEEVLMPAAFVFGSSAVADVSSHPEDQDLIPAPLAFTLRLASTLAITRGRDTYRDLLDNVAALWGYTSASRLLATQQQQLVAFAAAAFQEMFARAEQLDYFNRTTRQHTLTASTNTITLATDVQNLHGYVRVHSDAQVVNPAATMAEVENYAARYLTDDDDTDRPHVYYVRRRPADTAYGMETVLVFSPTPANDVVLDLEVTLNAPRYSWADYLNATPLTIVHRYAASVLYPLVRQRATATIDFVAKDQLPMIERQYQQARQILGYVDPTPPPTKGPAEPAPVAA